jgi:hypothetical protein
MYFYCFVYVFLLLCMFCSVYSVFIMPTGTLQLPWLRFFHAFSSVVRQMPRYNSQRRGTAHTLPIISFSLTTLGSNPRKPSKICSLWCSMYCLCVNVYCTAATGCQHNCRKKGIAVPLQAWSGPEGSRKLSFPDFMTTAQDDGKVVSLTHRPPLPPGNTPGTHFC